MKLLVTGGAGFIGSNFIHYWLKRYPGDEIVNLDALTYAGHLENLRDIEGKPNYKFIHGDICDPKIVRKAMEGADVVVHFAAESHVDRSLSGLENEIRFYRTNVEGTATLLQAAHEAGVKRFHHISTDEVFGDLSYDSKEKFHEGSPSNLHSPYAISKAAADFRVRAFAREILSKEGSPFPFTISNCTNNYGPYQTPEKIVPRFILLLLEGKPVPIYTDAEGNMGRNVRDWLHVEDHCEAIDLILKKGKEGETYCIGGNCELSNLELTEKILEKMGKEPFERWVTPVADRPGHDRRYAMDTTKIEGELGWKPHHTFAEGLRETIEWYTTGEGREWVESLRELSTKVHEGQDKSVRGKETKR
ncbi:dTDP-glucose 4,6-dehydratase [Candidatus Shapirobacteria bacterium CG10_big_fil_rev_8_21_14_0_10_40_9]|uniref:dTDP-glucose 4,6-dehydratase n=1 Tax=Candidatus Shapirobacteria bacterium CG10_big_fil_rev_8_21_14_0_10_40_9 TaxID=1974888 RepID=A0A2M8L2Y7_9BACT|nr:MAG: dTDP-glucose 4,6-dehydratase [Candidatus Shapirobacteria bacterium CG10_big_fil_rev_8_21_14_0_10_40_9]